MPSYETTFRHIGTKSLFLLWPSWPPKPLRYSVSILVCVHGTIPFWPYWIYVKKYKSIFAFSLISHHGPLTLGYVKLRVVHAPGMPRHRLQRKPPVSDLGMHHGTCVTHVPWCMSGSLTRDGGENVPSIPGTWMRNPQFYVSGKRPIETAMLLGSFLAKDDESVILHSQLPGDTMQTDLTMINDHD